MLSYSLARNQVHPLTARVHETINRPEKHNETNAWVADLWVYSQAAGVRAMSTSARVCHVAAAAAQLLVLALLSCPAPAEEPPPAVVDSATIIHSLKSSSGVATRGLQVEPTAAAASDSGGSGKITLDIRFDNNSDRLTQGTEAQLDALGSALESAQLARARFLIAGHTSATGSAEHNRKLSEARARGGLRASLPLPAAAAIDMSQCCRIL